MSRIEQTSPLRKREGDLVRGSYRGGVVIGAIRLTGITRLLQEECWPRYDYAMAVHGLYDEDEPVATRSVGQEVGRLVDRQITSLVRLMWTYALDWAHIPGASIPPHPRPPATMKPTDARLLIKMQQLAGKTHAFTREFFRQLRKHRMMPVQSQVQPMLPPPPLTQVPVGSEAHRIGTMVDVVVAPSSHVQRSRSHNSYTLCAGARVLLLEVKCGFQRTYRRHTGQFMRFPASWVDTPQAQHQLQVAVTRALFERTYQTPIAGAYVIRLYEARRRCRRRGVRRCAQGGAKWYLQEELDPRVLNTLMHRLSRRATSNEHART